MPFTYHEAVLAELARHGVKPLAHTPPELVRGYVRELYKFEIKRLRDRLIAGAFPRSEYAGRVDALRRQYPVLALQPFQFVE